MLLLSPVVALLEEQLFSNPFLNSLTTANFLTVAELCATFV